ncbi:glycogen synthase [Aquimarina agarilytica]|uniref:glycogen synthase n=1 Tax=Aquimarina agarilytica TaxID=1087449 RepID=UPI000289D6B1|nr:glycogen/starch synthase [Aquimarina agarilytica]
MNKIIHVTAECYPIAKVGGLADVVGALPKYQEKSGITSQVVMPFYDKDFTKSTHFNCVINDLVYLGETAFEYEILEVPKKQLGFSVFLIKIENLTDRENVYGYHDDTERFTAFQKVVADFVLQMELKPDVIHCHDHHTGLLPFFMSYAHKYNSLKTIPTVLTIHNAQYQGWFSFDKLHYFPEYDLKHSGIIEWDHQINPLATAIKSAWKVTTVSPSYLIELQQKANGLEWLLSHENQKSIGILNGVDPDVWNPKTDPLLESNFGLQNVASGRKGNKDWICNKFNLDPTLPLVAFIGRFVYEKGSDLLPEVISTVFDQLKLKVNILVLGSGDMETTEQLKNIQNRYKGNYNHHIGYNEKLSHIIYGGADFLLMPSRVEPCGLNQMYALAYGMIPIVSKVGGLIDTIIDVDQEHGFGITMNTISVHEICFGIQRAVDIYANKPFYNKLQKLIMKIDNSWNRSAKQYIHMYHSLKNN